MYKKKVMRDSAHPHSLTNQDISRLINNKFKTLFREESPWIGLRNYVLDSTKSQNNEIIMILKK